MTDGIRYDTGPDGAFFHALVTHVREADKGGNIITYRQEPDGQLIKTGVIEKVDPQASKKTRRFTHLTGSIVYLRSGTERTAVQIGALLDCVLSVYRSALATAAFEEFRGRVQVWYTRRENIAAN